MTYDGAAPDTDLRIVISNSGPGVACVKHLDFIERYSQIEIKGVDGKFIDGWFSDEVGKQGDYQNNDYIIVNSGSKVQIPYKLSGFDLKKGERYSATFGMKYYDCSQILGSHSSDIEKYERVRYARTEFIYSGPKLIGEHYPFLK